MKLTAKIRRIDYGDLVEMALPMIRELFKTENEAIRLTIDSSLRCLSRFPGLFLFSPGCCTTP